MLDRPGRKPKPQLPGRAVADDSHAVGTSTGPSAAAAAAVTNATALPWPPRFPPVATNAGGRLGHLQHPSRHANDSLCPLSLFQPPPADAAGAVATAQGRQPSEHEHLISASELSLNRVVTRTGDLDATPAVGPAHTPPSPLLLFQSAPHCIGPDAAPRGGLGRSAAGRRARAASAAAAAADADASWGPASESGSAYDGDSDGAMSPQRNPAGGAKSRARGAAQGGFARLVQRANSDMLPGRGDAAAAAHAAGTGQAAVVGDSGRGAVKRASPAERFAGRRSAKRSRCAVDHARPHTETAAVVCTVHSVEPTACTCCLGARDHDRCRSLTDCTSKHTASFCVSVPGRGDVRVQAPGGGAAARVAAHRAARRQGEHAQRKRVPRRDAALPHRPLRGAHLGRRQADLPRRCGNSVLQ